MLKQPRLHFGGIYIRGRVAVFPVAVKLELEARRQIEPCLSSFAKGFPRAW